MTDHKRVHFLVLAVAMIVLASLACGGSSSTTPVTQPSGSTAVEAADRATPTAAKDDFVPGAIVLAGKVVNSRTGEWPNDRLVLLFLKGQEVGRDTTSMRDVAPITDQGIMDGVFAVSAPNAYGVGLSQLDESGTSFTRFQVRGSEVECIAFGGTACEMWAQSLNAYHWFGAVEEGSTYHIPIPSKNTEYVLKVIEGDIALLPAAIQSPGSTSLKDDGTIVVALPETGPGETASPGVDAEVQTIKYDDAPRPVELNKFTVSIDNCAGSAPITQKYTQSQSFIHEYHTSVTGGIGLEISLFWLKVVPQLQVESGYSNGQIETKTIEYEMQAEPKTRVTYVFTWQEEWKSGVAEVTAGGDLISIPFEIRSNLIYSTQSEPSSCQ